MGLLRPRDMTQEDFAQMLREAGFPACCKAAVSLAERSEATGVQFTQKARNAAQSRVKQARKPENRKNGRKTTVWLDDELREWVETRAYMEDLPVGEFIRRIIREAKEAAGAAATAPTVMETGGIGDPSISDHNTNERRNQA